MILLFFITFVFGFVGKYCPVAGPHAFKIAYPSLVAAVDIASIFLFPVNGGGIDRVENAWTLGPNVQASGRALFPLFGQVHSSVVGDRFLLWIGSLRCRQTFGGSGLGLPVFFSGRFGNGHPVDNAEGRARFVRTLPGSWSPSGDSGDRGQFPVVYDNDWRFIVHDHHTANSFFMFTFPRRGTLLPYGLPVGYLPDTAIAILASGRHQHTSLG
jgi:hypothetical protein